MPAVVLVELIAQTGGFAACSQADNRLAPHRLRVPALGRFKFPGAATPPAMLEAAARVVGRIGRMVKIEGEVTADGRPVAVGSLTLAEVA